MNSIINESFEILSTNPIQINNVNVQLDENSLVRCESVNIMETTLTDNNSVTSGNIMTTTAITKSQCSNQDHFTTDCSSSSGSSNTINGNKMEHKMERRRISLNYRLKLFVNFTKDYSQFKSTSKLIWKKLAKCGLEPTSIIDNFICVKCFSCKFILKINVNQLDFKQLYNFHLSQPCPYVKSLKSNRKYLSVPDIPLSKRFIHSFFNSYARRGDTFKSNLLSEDTEIDIGLCTDSGFWFANDTKQTIVCYSCNLNLSLEEYKKLKYHIDIYHLLKRPNCYHMQMKYTKISKSTGQTQYIRLLQTEDKYQVCEICLDRHVNFKFLPCNHIYSCYSCTPNLSKCPLCREIIYSIVKY